MRAALLPALLMALSLSACVDTTNSFQETTDRLLGEGKLRTDYAPADVPFDNADLARNFVKIALFLEGDSYNETAPIPKPLKRWEVPLRYQAIGKGVTDADRAVLASLGERLASVTGRALVEVEKDPNFFIMILDADERSDLSRSFKERGSRAPFAEFLDRWSNHSGATCVGGIGPKEGPYSKGIVAIKDEIKGVYRESCLHEEVTQAYGLTNDSNDVRPSIFNDDREFALLTEHDEYLLRILYHPKLRNGMTEDEVRPLLPEIIAEIRPEGES